MKSSMTRTSGDLPLPIQCQEACANCSRRLTWRPLASYASGNINTQQGLELLFKCRQIPATANMPNSTKFCQSCDKLFEKLIQFYSEFLRASSPGSYVQNLWQFVSERVNEEKSRPYDHQLFTGVQDPNPDEEGKKDDNDPLHPVEVIIVTEVLEAMPASNSTEESNIPLVGPSTSSTDPLRKRTRSRKSTQNLQSLTIQEPVIKKRKEKDEELRFINNSASYLSYLSSKRPSNILKSTEVQMQPAPGRKHDLKRNLSIGGPANLLQSTSTEVQVQPIRGRKDDLKSQVLEKRGLPKEEEPFVEARQRNIHECLFCHEMFPTQLRLRIHNTAHHAGDRPRVCTECSKSFQTDAILLQHFRKCHPNQDLPQGNERINLTPEEKALLRTSEYKCDDDACAGELTFPSFKDWVLHQEWTHKVDTGYANAESVDTLVPIHRLIRPCPQCGKKFNTRAQVILHLKRVHLQHREFPCEFCEKSYSSQNYLASHVKAEHKKQASSIIRARDFVCKFCGTAFVQKSNLVLHGRLHFDEVNKKFECEICSAKYDSARAMSNHKASRHGEDYERNFTCDQCEKIFKTKQILNRHKKQQHVKKFILDEFCELCGKRFAFKKKLKLHLMSVHKVEKEETRVPAKIKRPSVFRILPNGDPVFNEKPTKPKSCNICGKKYVRREQLFTHMISHHGKTEEEAKGFTGLESKRTLVPARPSRSRGRCSKPKPSSIPLPVETKNKSTGKSTRRSTRTSKNAASIAGTKNPDGI